MRGSCILSAGILIVIAGITSPPSSTQHHRQQLDMAMATPPSFQSQTLGLLASPNSCAASPYNWPEVTPSGYRTNTWLSWDATRHSNTYDPLPILLAGHGIQDCLRTESKPPQHAFTTAPSQQDKAIYPQPIAYYLSEKSPQNRLDPSRIRVVKLREFSPLKNAQQSIAQLLPAIDRFLATFPIRIAKPEQPAQNQTVSTQESWTQAPYFQKYGYKYTINEEPQQESQTADLANGTEDWTQAPYFQKYGYDYTMNDGVEKEAKDSELATDTQDHPSKPTVPEFVSNPINGTIGPEAETEVAESNSWFSDAVTTNEWFGIPDEAEEESVASNEEAEDYEDDFDYAENYLAYEGKYQMFYQDDYEIEYEAYEEGDMLGETSDEQNNMDQDEATTKSPDSNNNTDKPSQEEERNDFSSPLMEDDIPPSTPSGSFDIYWEETEPNVL